MRALESKLLSKLTCLLLASFGGIQGSHTMEDNDEAITQSTARAQTHLTEMDRGGSADHTNAVPGSTVSTTIHNNNKAQFCIGDVLSLVDRLMKENPADDQTVKLTLKNIKISCFDVAYREECIFAKKDALRAAYFIEQLERGEQRDMKLARRMAERSVLQYMY